MRVSFAMMSGGEIASLEVDPSLKLSGVLALLKGQAADDCRSSSREHAPPPGGRPERAFPRDLPLLSHSPLLASLLGPAFDLFPVGGGLILGCSQVFKAIAFRQH